MKIRSIMVVSAVFALGACASMTPTFQTESAYLILDVKGNNINRGALLDSITNAVKGNMSSVTVSRDIPPATLPEQPARFVLKDITAGSNLGAMLQSRGYSSKVPVCDGQILTLASRDTSMGQYGQSASFNLCVIPYKAGYQVDIYATTQQSTGGFSTATLGATISKSLVGDIGQFIPRTMNDVKKAMEATGGKVSVVDSYIPDSFKGPLVNQTAELLTK